MIEENRIIIEKDFNVNIEEKDKNNEESWDLKRKRKNKVVNNKSDKAKFVYLIGDIDESIF